MSSPLTSFARRIGKKSSSSSSLSQEQMLYIQKLRTDNPRKNSPFRLSRRFNIPESVIKKEAPPFELKEKMRNDMIKIRRESKTKEDPALKIDRLSKWKQKQLENTTRYRNIKHEYERRRNKVIYEVDEAIWKASDTRDEMADVAAEKIRIEKRKMFGMKKKK